MGAMVLLPLVHLLGVLVVATLEELGKMLIRPQPLFRVNLQRGQELLTLAQPMEQVVELVLERERQLVAVVEGEEMAVLGVMAQVVHQGLAEQGVQQMAQPT